MNRAGVRFGACRLAILWTVGEGLAGKWAGLGCEGAWVCALQ